MIDLFGNDLLPFTISIALMLGMVVIEGVGMLLGATFSSLLDAILPDFDPNIDIEISQNALTKVLGWMNVGRVPLLVIIIAFLTIFGIMGFILQFFVYELIGMYLNVFVAVVLVFVISLPVTKSFTKILQKILPKDESSAISVNDLIGKVVTITLAKSIKGNPAEAKFTDIHGQTHYIMVEPQEDGVVFEQGESVILSKKNSSIFYAIKNENRILNN
ncbi:YqiJ family protein [Candidatus Woesearchaeota archaeon]|nr:YqiJ family protein [Candidatus Woesearchaeota archaeon]